MRLHQLLPLASQQRRPWPVGSARIGRGGGGGKGSPVWCYWADLEILGGWREGGHAHAPALGGERAQGLFCDAGFQFASAGVLGHGVSCFLSQAAIWESAIGGNGDGEGGSLALGWCWAMWCLPECPHCAAGEGAGSAGIAPLCALAPPRHSARTGGPRERGRAPRGYLGEGGRNRRGKRREKKKKKTKTNRAWKWKMSPCRKGTERKGKNTVNPFVFYTSALKMAFFTGNGKKKCPRHCPKMQTSSQKLGLRRWLVLCRAKLTPAGNTLRCSTWVLMAPNATADWSLEPPLCFTAGALLVSQPQPPKLPPLSLPAHRMGARQGHPGCLHSSRPRAGVAELKSLGSPGRDLLHNQHGLRNSRAAQPSHAA